MRKYVLPVHVALGRPALGHVDARTSENAGTTTVQSCCFCPGERENPRHCCTLVLVGSGPGGGAVGGRGGGGKGGGEGEGKGGGGGDGGSVKL